MKNHMDIYATFFSLLLSQCGFVVFHIIDSVTEIGAYCEKSQNSMTGLPIKETALATPDKTCSRTGCGSCEQHCENRATVIHFLNI